MPPDLSPAQQRTQDPFLLAALSLPALLPKLPLSLPLSPDTPPSPKPVYRSQYHYPGYQDLLDDPTLWSRLSPFDLALRLLDFSSLEAPLARILYRPSPRGHPPFHPVSMFLLFSWRLYNQWPRTQTLLHLAEDRYADYRHTFGFADGVYPTEGGLRYWESRLGSQSGDPLIKQTMDLAHNLGCLSPEALARGIFSVDGMLHDALSRLRCRSVTDSCYEPAPRPCPAKEEKKHKGCDCTSPACTQVCQYATPRDPQAHYVVYRGHNQTDGPNAPAQPSPQPSPAGKGKARYGYRSLAGRLIDALRRCSWVLNDDLLSANAAEDPAATKLMKQAVNAYPWVNWGFAVADAGEGREPFLSTAYELGLRRVVGLRKGDGDNDKVEQAMRGYDYQGIPICKWGYRLHPNGWDYERRRQKWCCERTCERQSDPPAPDCAIRREGGKHGLVKDVGPAFDDGKNRLVRDVPYGSPLWKAIYGRARNAAEERNAELEGFGLKRMPVAGWKRVRAMLTVADMWVNLATVIRLVREAVLATSGPSPPVAAPTPASGN